MLCKNPWWATPCQCQCMLGTVNKVFQNIWDWEKIDCLPLKGGTTLSKTLPPAFCNIFSKNSDFFLEKTAFLFLPTQPWTVNCWCIRMDGYVPIMRALRAGAPWVLILHRRQHLDRCNGVEPSHWTLPWTGDKHLQAVSFKEITNVRSSWITN